ncbi:MAG: phospholipid carrier-dependent glycosyltransferase [Phycisphaerae bacterium]
MTFLVMIGIIWLFAWRVGYRWCRRCSIDERASAWALACVFPTAGLIFAVHLMALASLLLGRGLVTPQSVALIFLVLTWLGHRILPPVRASKPKTRHTAGFCFSDLGYWRIPVLLVVGMYAVFLVDALTRYPTGYDTLSYHLCVAVDWMRWQALDLVVGNMHWSFPENGMIVPFLLSFAKLERLFPLVHLPKGLLLAAVTYGLARSLGVSHLGAWVSLCVVASIPVVVCQSFSGYIDLYAAASWLSALLALAWAARAQHEDQRYGLLIIAGLSAGVALGSKTTFLVTVPLLGVVAMAVEWIRPRVNPADYRRPIRNLAIFGVAALVCSAFWFTRATVRTGNPVYPLGVTIGGRVILPGYTSGDWSPKRTVVEKVRRWWDYPWRETRNWGTGYPYSVNKGVGAAYGAFVPLGLLAAVLSCGTRLPRTAAEKWRLVFLLLSLSGLMLFLTVFCEMVRFVLPQLLLTVPIAAVLIDRLVEKFPRSMLVTLTVALITTAAVATFKPAHSYLARVKNGVWDRTTFYGIPPLINELEPAARILNLSDAARDYPLLGNRLSNLITDPLLWNWLLGDETISGKALRGNGIDYIYVQEPWPDDWPDELPIELVYDDSDKPAYKGIPAARIYRVRPTKGR